MKKIDFKKELKHLYQPSAKEVVLVEVPAMNFLIVDGQGDPNTSRSYQEAVEALFSVAYAIKFKVKKTLAIDYGVLPLEGLWWADDMAKFSVDDKSAWMWTMMIMQPEFVNAAMVRETIAEVKKKKNPPALAQLRFSSFNEGKAAQILHIGPFSAEGPTIARVHAFISSLGKLSGKHHEIYLSDIRKADPAKWKTVIRQPLR
ncbi:MAG: GyrI-like domain-containing protein [Candidatus Aminicenantes bacterium]|nr:GyrI-like domain-containing protein [Candidatus Aminicenantes bacterium]